MYLVLSMLAVYACAVCAVSASVPPKQCSSKTEETRGFKLRSSINGTGHWQYKVDLIHMKSETYRPWTVALNETTVKCDGAEYVLTTALISASESSPGTTAPQPVAAGTSVPNHVAPALIFPIKVTAATTAKPVPRGYEFYPGMGYYKLHTISTVWDSAKIICTQEGGHLAVINSEQEAAVLVNIAAKSIYSSLGAYISIGFHDKYQEGKYLTIFDTPISADGYTNWCGNQPDNARGNENCGSIVKSIGCLNDIPCDDFPIPFFCEQKL